jgi:hypothetical protein
MFSIATIASSFTVGGLHELAAAEQPDLFAVERDEQQAALRVFAEREGARHFDQRRRAGRVVVGAGVDASVAPSEMVVVRADHDVLLLQFGIRTFQHADHVAEIEIGGLRAAAAFRAERLAEPLGAGFFQAQVPKRAFHEVAREHPAFGSRATAFELIGREFVDVRLDAIAGQRVEALVVHDRRRRLRGRRGRRSGRVLG